MYLNNIEEYLIYHYRNIVNMVNQEPSKFELFVVNKV